MVYQGYLGYCIECDRCERLYKDAWSKFIGCDLAEPTCKDIRGFLKDSGWKYYGMGKVLCPQCQERKRK